MRIIYLIILLSSSTLLSAGVLDSVLSVPHDEMPEVARLEFNESILYMDSANALATMNALLEYAEAHSHTHMEIMMTGLKGIYYMYRLPEQKKTAISLFKEAIQKAENHNVPIEMARFTHHLGNTLCFLGNYPEGLGYMLKANNMMLKIGYGEIPGVESYLYSLARIYFLFRNYEKAESYLEKALSYAAPNENVYLASLNLSAIIDAENERPEKALATFKKAAEIVTFNRDSAGIGMIYGNMGSIYLEMGNIDTAEKLLHIAYHLDTAFGTWENALSALFRISEAHLKKGELEQAGEWIAKCFHIMSSKNMEHNEAWQEYYVLKKTFFFEKGMYEKAYLYSDSLLGIKSKMTKETDANMLANLSAQLMAEKYLTDIQLLENEKKVQKIVRNSLLTIAAVIILFLIWLFYSQQKKRQQEKKAFLAEQQKARENLRNFRNRILDKNRLIEKFKDQLHQHKNSEAGPHDEEIIQKLYESIILTEDDWLEFKRLFENVYPGFLQKMQLEYPSLTIAEIRLIALTKLNLSVSEMANMLGILPQSVRKTRQRLMKKLNIEHHKDLPLFLTDNKSRRSGKNKSP